MKHNLIILLLASSALYAETQTITDELSEQDSQSEGVYRRKKCKSFNQINACSASITNLAATNAAFTNLAATNAVFANLDVTTAMSLPGTYSHAANINTTQLVAPNADVVFTDSLLLSSSDVTIVPLNSTTFSSIIVPAGAYAFFFSVDGVDAAAANTPLLFGLFNKTTGSPVPAAEFHSSATTGTITNVSRGFGVAVFPTTTTLSLRNFAADAMNLSTYADGGVNASFGLIRFGRPS